MFRSSAACKHRVQPTSRIACEPLETRRLLSATPLTFVVTDTSNSPTDTGSLPYAVAQANVAGASSIITFSPAAFPATTNTQITIADGGLLVDNPSYPITINGLDQIGAAVKA